MSDLYSFLKMKRLEAQLSQQEVAQRAEVSLATVQNIEAGRANPALNTLLNICNVLGLTLSATPTTTSEDYLSQLIQIGVPLMESDSIQANSYRGVQTLLQVLNESGMRDLRRFKSDTREEKALASYLWALRDHYPTLWNRLDGPLKNWFETRKPSVPSIKLRRIALQNLSEVL